MAELKRTGEWQNTYVIFTSDNGVALGEHRWLGRKSLPYEEMLRVPLIMTGPGIPAGAQRDQAVTMGDVATTIADIAGVPTGVAQDGESLLPLATGTQPDGRDRMVPIESGPFRGKGGKWLFRGVRTDQYTYFHWGDGFVELYDRDADPYQVQSVANDPEYADVLTYLRDVSSELETCAGGDCLRVYEGPAPITP